MVLAIQPPDAFLPRRNGSISFNSDSPPIYAPGNIPNPEDTETGRDNNQGFEAITVSPDGKTLYTMIQSALDQEGGPKKQHRQPARILEYDISSPDAPVYKHEYVALLPKYRDYTKSPDDKEAYRVASQSEIHILPTGDFLVLARDSNFGNGQEYTRSVYRHADIFSISTATDLKGSKYDSANGSIASSKGVLKPGIMPVEYCEFIDYNVKSELARFGMRNGGKSGPGLLNEKWESLALVPLESESNSSEGGKEYLLFSFSDNDFMTQDGECFLLY